MNATRTQSAPASAPGTTATAVVTGLGVAAPNGCGIEDYWRATLRGESGIGRITRFDPSGYPCRLAGEVSGFDPAAHIPGRLMPQTDHMTRLALAATGWALADAGADPAALEEFGMSVVTANAFGGFEFGHRELEKLWSRGGKHVSAYQSFAWFYAVNTGQISIRHGMRGPSGVLVSEQAGGLDAAGQARRHIRKGTPFVVTGGVDGALSPWGWVAYLSGGQVSTGEDPARAYLPFDTGAAGWVPGEGGAIIIVEEEAAARARGAAQIYGEIAGYSSGIDPAPHTGRPPALPRVVRQALADAGLEPGDIGVVFADAAGLPELDAAEAAAITEVFGPRAVPVTAPKTMVGRLASGGSALDTATAFLALRDQVIPPTVHVTDPAGPAAHLDLVLAARETPLTSALVLARGTGGFTAALVLRTAG
ncbi:ketosynthase chain-length factor [Actinacidiphila epipremni]|uniref:Ketosynthase chain-length factor n=1 Tax=Actinacidiphila epipremni TaxID=2053013 RepID=A0ABX0ZU09_9ACTN|nr:ketosynthase chain-length factor [Actinacidiphila epipremni]NJP46061.1 ketosynthase chain-length factor [Actinacidiphila epipremni]